MFGIVIKNAGRRKEMLYNFTLRKKEDKGLGQTRAVCFAASMRWRERVWKKIWGGSVTRFFFRPQPTSTEEKNRAANFCQVINGRLYGWIMEKTEWLVTVASFWRVSRDESDSSQIGRHSQDLRVIWMRNGRFVKKKIFPTRSWPRATQSQRDSPWLVVVPYKEKMKPGLAQHTHTHTWPLLLLLLPGRFSF